MSDQWQPPASGGTPPPIPSPPSAPVPPPPGAPGGHEPPAPNFGTPPPGYNNPATQPPVQNEPLPGLPYEPPPGYDAGGAVPPPVAGGPTVEKANFGQRLLAYFVDTLILYVPMWIIFAVVVTQLPTKGRGLCIDRDDNIVSCDPLTDGSVVVVFVMLGAMFVIGLLYYVLLEGRSGQTIGKKAANIRVVDDRSLQTIGAGRAIGRFFGRLISGFPLGLGYFWMLWDKDKQTWHDKMTSSTVIKNN